MSIKQINYLFALLFVFQFGCFAVFAQTTAFTFQDRLIDQGAPTNGQYDFEFELYDKPAGGGSFGLVSPTNIEVRDGNYAVNLDFGDKFPGAERYIEIRYRLAGSGAPFTPAAPRRIVTSAPYAIKSLNANKAEWADSADRLNGIAASEYVQTTDSRLSDSRVPVAGSNDYIQNRTTQQALSNFSISGSGWLGGTLSANTVNVGNQYNINGQRVLINTYDALAVGFNTGGGTYLGYTNNSFFGNNAGRKTQGGWHNAFFGYNSGTNNLGSKNSFFGTSSGVNNSYGDYNSFVGSDTGSGNTTGFYNSFLGYNAGNANTVGYYNTLVGENANLATGNLTNASAFGSKAFVSQNNSVVLGSINGVNGANASANVGIGTTAPQARLHVVGGVLFTDGSTIASRGDLNLLSSSANADFYMQGNGNNKGINFGVWSGSSPNASLFISQYDGITYLDRLMINANGTIGIGTLSSIAGATHLCLNNNHEIAPCFGYAALNEPGESLQKQIDAQNEIIKSQQAQIDALKQLVCQQNAKAEICQPK